MTLNPDSTVAPVQTEPPVIPEHMVIVLLEGGQRVLVKLEEAIASGNLRLKDHFIKKAVAILDELRRRLNREEGGELVENLDHLYDWWHREILLGRSNGDIDRLKRVRAQMDDMRQAWEYVLFKGEGMSESPGL